MPLILPGNVGSATAATGYNVANSVRFNGVDHDLRIAPGSASNKRTMTISFWTKRSSLGGTGSGLIAGWGDGYEGGFASMIYFNDADELEIDHDVAGADYNFHSDMVFRDVSAWYHIVIAIDTTQGTEANRQKIYVNGTQITLTETALGFPPEDFDTFFNNTLTVVGSSAYEGGSGKVNEYSGYFSEFVMIDGTALAADQFGEFDSDSGIWKPIDVSGLTFGTNGFYLEFKESGTSQNASGLGADTSGNTNHLAVTALTATDQSTDTCTNNFATLNGVAIGLDATLSEGNLKMASGTATTRSGTASTIGLSKGKWFAEFKITVSANGIVGIAGTTQNKSATDDDDIGNYPGRTQQGYGYLSGGDVYNDSSAVTGSFASFTTDDIIGVAVDLDGDLLYFYKNGAIQNSGTGIDISGITPHSGNWFFAVGDGSGSTASTVECNFGNPITALSSAVADGNGFGAFEFTPKSGHLALCTKNLAENG